MSKIGDKLKHLPDRFLEFDHNGQVKDFMIELGVSSQFKSNLKGPSGEKEVVQSVMVQNYPTHFILIVLYTGYDDPKDNGYFAVCAPKSKFNRDKFLEMCKQVLKITEENFMQAVPFRIQDDLPSN